MQDQIIKVVENICRLSGKQVEPQLHLIEDLGFDSIMLLDLISQLEAEFEVVFEDEDLDLQNFSSVDHMSKLIGRIHAKNP